jgi:RNA polymerase sigma-70 factor (ECF subfamily)
MVLTGYIGLAPHLERWIAVQKVNRGIASSMDPTTRLASNESSSEDKELALAFKQGDNGAYDAIYGRYSPRVNRVCRRLLNDPHDAQEAAQEAFLRVYQALPRFNGQYQLGAWITRITTNVCLDQLRSKGRRPVLLTPAEELEDGQLANEMDEPEAWVLRRAESRKVRRVLEAMPPMHRVAIVMRDFEGFSYEEIAVSLDISDSQVKALIHRARKNFKRTWAPSNVAALLPLRWFRREAIQGTERATEVARSASPLADAAVSVGHAATSCSVVLQQCGQFLTERFATLATTVAITTVAVGTAASGQVIGQVGPPASERVIAEVSPSRASMPKAPEARKRGTSSKAPLAQGSSGSSVTPSASPTPTSTPTPTPTPTPTQTPAGGGGGGTDKRDSVEVTPPAGPPPFTPVLSFGQPTQSGRAPLREVVSLNCGSSSFDHDMSTHVEFQGALYESRLQLVTSQTSRWMMLSVKKDGREFRYSSWGSEPVAVWESDGSRMKLSISGSYGPLHGSPDPAGSALPSSGNFQAVMTLDCAASRVVTLSVVY